MVFLARTSCSLLLSLTLIFLGGCSHMLFYPMKQHVRHPALKDSEFRDIYINTPDRERLHAWLFPANTPQPKASIVFFHGNGENISTHASAVAWLQKEGYQILAMDYRGYGKSSGSADLDGAISDQQATIEYAFNELIQNEPVVLMGQSLGASMLIYVASQTPYKPRINGILLIAPFSDYRQITREILAKSWLTWWAQWPLSLTINNAYRPMDFIARIAPTPVYIMHGKQDNLIAPEHSRLLFQQAANPKKFIALYGGHNNLFSYQQNRQSILQALSEMRH